MTLKPLAAAVALAATTFTASYASATELRLATIAPDKSIWSVHANRYADRVEELSGGAINVEVFGNAELGTMADTMKMALGGRVDIWFGVTPVMASVTPELATLTFPYLFENTEQVKCAVPKLDGEIRAAIGNKYELLSMLAVGSQSIGMVGDAKLPADLKGKKIRSAPLPSSLAFFKGMGATPQPLPAAETPAALSTGLVEGVDLAAAFYVLTGSNKVASNLVPTLHVLNLGGAIMSARSWAKLSDEEEAIMREAAEAIAFPAAVDDIVAFENKMVEAHLAAGGTVTELSEEDRAEWVAAGRGVWDDILADMGDSSKAFMDAVAAARESCAG